MFTSFPGSYRTSVDYVFEFRYQSSHDENTTTASGSQSHNGNYGNEQMLLTFLRRFVTSSGHEQVAESVPGDEEVNKAKIAVEKDRALVFGENFGNFGSIEPFGEKGADHFAGR